MPTPSVELHPYSTVYNGNISWSCLVNGLTITSNVELSDEQWMELYNSVVTEPEMPVAEEQVQSESPIESEFKRQRDSSKLAAIAYVHEHPECTLDEVVLACGSLCPLINAGYLIWTYANNAAAQGMIAEATFDAFRDMVCSMTLEQLMAL